MSDGGKNEELWEWRQVFVVEGEADKNGLASFAGDSNVCSVLLIVKEC